jgi:hypothetical protein
LPDNFVYAVLPDANGALLTKWLNDPLLKWDAIVSAKLINILKTIGVRL